MSETHEPVDVVVVGAGVSGLACAWALLEAGLRVALIERGRPGAGSTARAAGLVVPGLCDHYNRLVRGVGREQARAIWAATIENGRSLAALIERFGLRCGWRGGGVWLLATWPLEAEDLETSLEMLRADGLGEGARWIDARALAAHSNAPRGLGALVFAHDGALEPQALVRGWLALLRERHGARLCVLERCTVLRIRGGSGELELETARGVVQAKACVVAAGADSGALVPFLEGALWPVRAQGFVTRPLERIRLEKPVSASYGHEYYRHSSDGRLYVAGQRPDTTLEEMTRAQDPTETFQRVLGELCARRLGWRPEAEQVAERFGASVAQTRDGLPLVGPVPGAAGVVACCGFNLRGLSLALPMGEAVARLIVEGEQTMPRCFLPGRLL